MPSTLKSGTRITWRTLSGTRSGRVMWYDEHRAVYTVEVRGEDSPSIVHPQDITRIYS